MLEFLGVQPTSGRLVRAKLKVLLKVLVIQVKRIRAPLSMFHHGIIRLLVVPFEALQETKAEPTLMISPVLFRQFQVLELQEILELV